MYLCRPVIRVCVEGVEEVILESGREGEPGWLAGALWDGWSGLVAGLIRPAKRQALIDKQMGKEVGGGGLCGAHTHFLSWPPLISSMLSWERRSGSIVAGVYVAAALGILSLVGGGRREFCDIVGELGSRDGCAGRGARRWAGLF